MLRQTYVLLLPLLWSGVGAAYAAYAECYSCVMPSAGCSPIACSVPGSYPTRDGCCAACPVPCPTHTPAPPAPTPPPAPAGCATWYDSTTHGAAFRNVRDFGAVGDGVADDTAALQAAINDGRGEHNAKRPAVVYLPPGDYLVGDTIILWYHTTLVGSWRCPSIIRLKPRATGFTTASALKPVLVTTVGMDQKMSGKDGRCWSSQKGCPKDNDANDAFYIGARHLTVAVGAGNPGAVGVMWRVAQGTSLRNVTIDAGDAAVGLDIGTGYATGAGYAAGGASGGGGGTIEHVDVAGGAIGVRGDGSQWLFSGVRVRGSAKACFQFGYVASFTLVGIEARDCPVGVRYHGRGSSPARGPGNMLLLMDAAFSNISSGSAVSSPARDSQNNWLCILLENIIVDSTVQWVVDSNQLAAPGAGKEVGLWRRGPGAYSDGGAEVKGTAGHMPRVRRAAVPQTPRPEPVAACNARDFGAKGDGATDDTTALQAAVAGCLEVFLPIGTYVVSDTVALRAGSHLAGEGLAYIALAPNAAGFGESGKRKAVMWTPRDPSASVVVADVIFVSGAGNPGAVLLDWGAGRGATYDVHYQLYNPVWAMLRIVGPGAGLVSNSWGWTADHNLTTYHSGGDRVKVPNPRGFVGESAGPVCLRGTAFEHSTKSNYQVSGASNYTLVQIQTEQPYFQPEAGQSRGVDVLDSEGVIVYGGYLGAGHLMNPKDCYFYAQNVTRTSVFMSVAPLAPTAITVDGHKVKGGSAWGHLAGPWASVVADVDL